MSVSTANEEEVANIESFDVIFHATPVGSKLASEDPYMFPIEKICAKHIVFDMVTALETTLTKMAQAKGAIAISGLRMLLFQALEQFQLFTEHEPPREAMEKALYAEFK